jgi:magnesium chelatase family protein
MTGSVEFPARFTLVAAANPCPCGFLGDPRRRCDCRDDRLQTYRQKLSGPLLDRIDIQLVVPRLSKQELLDEAPGEPSAPIRRRVEAARELQRRRYAGSGHPCNAQLPGPLARRVALVSPPARDLLANAVDGMALTGRGFDRALKVARTIADLDGAPEVERDHVSEALMYRMNLVDEGLARAG